MMLFRVVTSTRTSLSRRSNPEPAPREAGNEADLRVLRGVSTRILPSGDIVTVQAAIRIVAPGATRSAA
jgi:hypothetical protein